MISLFYVGLCCVSLDYCVYALGQHLAPELHGAVQGRGLARARREALALARGDCALEAEQDAWYGMVW